MGHHWNRSNAESLLLKSEFHDVRAMRHMHIFAVHLTSSFFLGRETSQCLCRVLFFVVLFPIAICFKLAEVLSMKAVSLVCGKVRFFQVSEESIVMLIHKIQTLLRCSVRRLLQLLTFSSTHAMPCLL